MASDGHSAWQGKLKAATDERAALVERIEAELAFARALVERHPEETPDGRRWIAEAEAIISEALAGGRLDHLEAAVARAEAALQPFGPLAKSYTLHCVGHAHIDMNWMWSWPETVAVTNDTFLTVLKLMEEFPQFHFTQSQASVYAIVRDYHPELLERIRARVKEGRWEVAAVHWVEGDKNLASGESLARHLLYTRRFLHDLLDLPAEVLDVDWEPDTFGHAASLPTILGSGGVRGMYCCRAGRRDLPAVFWWRGRDGTQVLCYREPAWYNGFIGTHHLETMLDFWKATGLRDGLYVFGVGDHGGGPTRRDLRRATAMMDWPIYPRLRFGTARGFLDLLLREGARWPTFEGELNFEFTGCYTSQSRIKWGNRQGENLMLEAEALAALGARAIGRAYPADQLREAWLNVLFGHFHDILPGSGVRWTREYQSALFQRTAAATAMIKTNTLRALAGRIDTRFAASAADGLRPAETDDRALGAGVGRGTGEGALSQAGHVDGLSRPFVVFNPLGFARRETVTVALWDTAPVHPGPDRVPNPFVVRDSQGRVHAVQVISSGTHWGHDYVEAAFPVEVGPLGYETLTVEPGEKPAPDETAARIGLWYNKHNGLYQGEWTIENQFIRAEFDPRTGGIRSLVDRSSGRDVAGPADPAAVLEYVIERPRGMSAWTSAEPRRAVSVEVISFKPATDGGYHVADGPNLVSFVAELRMGDSTATITYSLAAGRPWLEVDIRVNWLERGGPELGTPRLTMRFPFALTGTSARYEVPFGSIRRDLSGGEEVPALRWADVNGRRPETGEEAGCAILNDCKYGHSLDGNTFRVVLLRSSYSPDPLPELGEHRIRLGLVPHAGAPSEADLARWGAALNHPLLTVATDVHPGDRAPRGAAIRRIEPSSAVLTAVKRAEESDDLIFRFLETAGRASTLVVGLDETLLGSPAEASAVDLLERPVTGVAVRLAGDGFEADLKPWALAGVRVRFR